MLGDIARVTAFQPGAWVQSSLSWQEAASRLHPCSLVEGIHSVCIHYAYSYEGMHSNSYNANTYKYQMHTVRLVNCKAGLKHKT